MPPARPKIVIAEDEPDIARLVAFKLRAAGYDVLIALDGRQALEVVAREGPDLLLLDAMMPVMDGWEVLARLRADEKSKNLPVILFTAQGQERDQIRGRAGGAQDYIVKPFAVADLLPRVQKWLGSSAESAPPAAPAPPLERREPPAPPPAPPAPPPERSEDELIF